MACETNFFAVFSKAVVREVPLGQIAGYLSVLGRLGPVAIGDACGNGCGSGCGNNCLRPIDQFGQTELTLTQLTAIAADKTRLRQELTIQIQEFTRTLGSA